MDKIILKVNKCRERTAEIIRITPEAADVLNRLSCETGLSIRYIASELIVQGTNLVEVMEE